MFFPNRTHKNNAPSFKTYQDTLSHARMTCLKVKIGEKIKNNVFMDPEKISCPVRDKKLRFFRKKMPFDTQS